MVERILATAWLALAIVGASTPAAAQSPGALPAVPTRLRIGVVAASDAELIAAAQPAAARAGLQLEAARFASVAQANAALGAGRIDANAVQDAPALQAANARHGYRLAAVAYTLTYPMGLYAGGRGTLAEVRPGATVAVPADAPGQGRALILLQNHGLLRIDRQAGLLARPADVTANPRRLKLVAVPAAQLPAWLGKAELVAMPYEVAARKGLAPARDALGIEDARVPYANVLAVREAVRDAPWVGAAVGALQSAEVKRFILARFQDSVRRPW